MLDQIIVLSTNIQSSVEVARLSPIFNMHQSISNWSIDTNDVDKVLRIECSKSITEIEIINLLKSYGVQCEEL